MQVLKRLIALIGLLVFGIALPVGPHAGERGKGPVEVTSVLVELTPPQGQGEERKEIVLCWEAAVDKGSVFGFAANGGDTPPGLGHEGYRETFQVPGMAVEIDKRRTEELGRKLANERVTVAVLTLTYHRKLQPGTWSFCVHSIPPSAGGLRLLGKVHVLIEGGTGTPSPQKNARPGEKSP
jgi:hypothetical protein